MVVCRTIKEIRAFVSEARAERASIGFVPTMGYFHEGHLSLMRRARSENDALVISIFVNPMQFGPGEDFAQYPRDIQRDLALAEKVEVDAAFTPDASEMYPEGYCTYIEVEGLSDKLCGRFRPGHFKGVATVVLKLFNIVQPDRAYFGQKDAQQLRVIQRMVEDLNLPVYVVPVPTVREPDGLAMSSRNVYLDSEERRAALVLSRSLLEARRAIEAGELDARKIVDLVRRMIQSEPLVHLEYVEACRFEDLEPVEVISGKVLLALAARVGKARLIDNIIISH